MNKLYKYNLLVKCMKKKAKEFKKGDSIILAGKEYTIESIEFSEIGKQGMRKCRLILKPEEGEKIAIVRPEDYPFDTS